MASAVPAATAADISTLAANPVSNFNPIAISNQEPGPLVRDRIKAQRVSNGLNTNSPNLVT